MLNTDEQHSGYDETAPHDNDGRSETRTGFDPTEAASRLVERDGQVYSKWEWLNQLNDGRWDQDRREQNNTFGLRNDVVLLVETINDMAETRSLDPERVMRFVEGVREDRENGLQFGSDRPLEATIIASATLIANLDGWPIRRDLETEDGTSGYEFLLDEFVPSDSATDKEDIRDLRATLREYL